MLCFRHCEALSSQVYLNLTTPQSGTTPLLLFALLLFRVPFVFTLRTLLAFVLGVRSHQLRAYRDYPFLTLPFSACEEVILVCSRPRLQFLVCFVNQTRPVFGAVYIDILESQSEIYEEIHRAEMGVRFRLQTVSNFKPLRRAGIFTDHDGICLSDADPGFYCFIDNPLCQRPAMGFWKYLILPARADRVRAQFHDIIQHFQFSLRPVAFSDAHVLPSLLRLSAQIMRIS